jgi:SAM-dependent methyltransferase
MNSKKSSLHEQMMMTVEDPLFDTSDQRLMDIWNEIQRLQVDFCADQEWPFYARSQRWTNAKRVLDLGTGNGYYLTQLAARFRDKEYLGIDASEELIQVARSRSQQNVQFTCQDMFSVEGKFDYVVMRLLLQHLRDPDAVLQKVAALTAPLGAALIIDAHDPARSFEPPLNTFMRFFRAYTDQQSSLGLDRSVAQTLEQRLAKHTAWQLGSAEQILITTESPGNLNRFRRIYWLFIEMVERSRSLNYDFAAVKRDWQKWCGDNTARAQAGLNLIQLDAVSDT